ncbi:MAG: hypothetical protein Q8M22_13635 [Actinomycetota bacterium]|nr:hypothetical protein [Actinomycetota bacterium]
MSETSDEMNTSRLRPGGDEPGPNEPTTDSPRRDEPGPDDTDVDAQPPGLYVDEETGPVPEPNEPA